MQLNYQEKVVAPSSGWRKVTASQPDPSGTVRTPVQHQGELLRTPVRAQSDPSGAWLLVTRVELKLWAGQSIKWLLTSSGLQKDRWRPSQRKRSTHNEGQSWLNPLSGYCLPLVYFRGHLAVCAQQISRPPWRQLTATYKTQTRKISVHHC